MPSEKKIHDIVDRIEHLDAAGQAATAAKAEAKRLADEAATAAAKAATGLPENPTAEDLAKLAEKVHRREF